MELDDRMTLASAEGIDLDLRLAGIGSRGVAVLVDLALQSITLLLIGLVAGASDSLGLAFASVAGFLALFAYPVLSEAFASGRTVGKALLGIAVLSTDGRPITFLSAVIRNLLRFVDLLPGFYLVGMVSVLATERSQRVGDLAAGTIVVHARSPRGPDGGPAPAAWGVTASSLPPEAAGWDVAAVTAEEVAAVRSFLERRTELGPQHRADLAQTLSFQILPKVAGVPLEGGPEVFLERVVAAKAVRR